MHIKSRLAAIQSKVAISIFILLFPFKVLAWTYAGHVLIAQIAYDSLTPAQQLKANSLTQSIFFQLLPEQQQSLNARYPTASTFAKVALLPDIWKNWKIQTLFSHYEAPLPANLAPYAQYTSATWHYIDTPYPDNAGCSPAAPNITTILPLLEVDLPKARQNIESAQAMHQKEIARNQAGLVLIMLTHLVGDAHQPLHTFGKITSGCQTDKGGNEVCLKFNKKGKCTKNLHSLWDSGVGFIKPRINITATAKKLEARYPRSVFTSAELANVSPSNWAAINVTMAPFVYTLEGNEAISPAYYQHGQALATTQMVLAGYRLAFILQHSGILEPYIQVQIP